MRLLYCSRDYTTHDLRFVRAAVQDRMEVFYLRLERDGVPYVGEPLPPGVVVVDWAGGGPQLPVPEAVAAYLPSYVRVLADLRPDVIHAGPVQSFGLMAALAGAAPTVLVSWGSDLLVDAHRDAWYSWASATALRHCDALFCDSAAVLAAARGLSGGALGPQLCLPWGPEHLVGPDQSSERARVRRERGWEDCFVVSATRAWHSGYRIPELVDAFGAAARRNPRLRLALLGTGEDAAAVQARIAKHGLAPRVYQPGVQDWPQLSGVLSAADAYLSLVTVDGTSISLLEAMSHGLPVVVTSNAGNTEWVEEGRTGFLVESLDPEIWADRLLTLAGDPQSARAMGEAGRAVVRARADWTRNAPQLVDLYRRTAGIDRRQSAGRHG